MRHLSSANGNAVMFLKKAAEKRRKLAKARIYLSYPIEELGKYSKNALR